MGSGGRNGDVEPFVLPLCRTRIVSNICEGTMAGEPTEYRVVGELRLDDETAIIFAVYSLNKRRLGSARIYREGKGYAGPTRSGFDMQLTQIQELVAMLRDVSASLEDGSVAPPTDVGRIASGSASEWVVRLLEPDAYHADVVLDVRKYVSTEKYTGWTKKGLRFSVDVLDEVLPHLTSVQEALVDWRDGRSGLFEADGDPDFSDGADEPEEALPVPPEYQDLF